MSLDSVVLRRVRGDVLRQRMRCYGLWKSTGQEFWARRFGEHTREAARLLALVEGSGDD